MAASVVSAVIPHQTLCPNTKLSTYERRQHRFTLFIGYGDESGALLKRFEQLKCRLGLSTNMQFLKHLVDFFEQKNLEITDHGPEIIKCNEESFENDASLLQNELSTTVEEHVENQVQSESVERRTKEMEQIFVSIQKGTNFKRSAPVNNELEKEVIEPLEKKMCAVLVGADRNNTEDLTPQQTVESSPLSELNFISSGTSLKAVKVIYQYMENIKNDLNYYHGFVSSAEKLKRFLDEYRKITKTTYTVRSSRSYIKKRALNAAKALKGAILEQTDLTIGATQTLQSELPETSKSVESAEGLILNEAIDTRLQQDLSDAAGDVNVTGDASTGDVDIESHDDAHYGILDPNKEHVIEEIHLPDDSIVTGPLRWEYILGKPPIPFTGVPFFIIGNTQYQCFYASADVRTQRRKCSVGSPTVRTRLRRSLKRDCKAVMCIKSIVSFPEFTIEETIHEVKTKKGCRKLKAATLDKVRQSVEKGESVGHPAFWVHVPLPEAHSTHDLVVDDDEKTTDNIDEISLILSAAAQYGGQVQLVQSTGDVVELKITDASCEIVSSSETPAENNELCFTEQIKEE